MPRTCGRVGHRLSVRAPTEPARAVGLDVRHLARRHVDRFPIDGGYHHLRVDHNQTIAAWVGQADVFHDPVVRP